MTILNDTTSWSITLKLSIMLIQKINRKGIDHDDHHLQSSYLYGNSIEIGLEQEPFVVFVHFFLI
jgi:hypothetical protein